MLRFVLFATLISVSLAKVGNYHRYRRNEGNENSVKYYRPKYVYKFHDEDSDEDYKYVQKDDYDDHDSSYKHYMIHEEEKNEDEKPEKVTHYGYQQTASQAEEDTGVQKETNHHVEIKHEHGTSHQSFQMHHFQPAKVFIKKQDLHYLKKPVEIGVTKHSFKFVHPKKMIHETKVESSKKYNLDENYDLKDHHYSYKLKEPKYEYHASKEIDVQPKKVVYHEYIEPTYEKKEPSKKYEIKDYYYNSKVPQSKIEYHIPKQYQHYHQYPYQQDTVKHQNYKHYTVYRGNNDSDEQTSHYEEGETDGSASEDVPHDIHVYH